MERQVLRMLLVGLVVARLAFVLQFRDAYLKSPLDLLDIRDGGWHAGFGLAAALAYAAVVLGRLVDTRVGELSEASLAERLGQHLRVTP